MNGKGDAPRPVDRKRYERGYDSIKWKSNHKTIDADAVRGRFNDPENIERARKMKR
jgi:hypothetical protein